MSKKKGLIRRKLESRKEKNIGTEQGGNASERGNKPEDSADTRETIKESAKTEQLQGQQAILAEKLLLEQSIAGVVGGKTGLLMLLDMLLHGVEEKNLAGFQFYAESYIRKSQRLRQYLPDYEQIAPDESRLLLYRKLLVAGEGLEPMLEDIQAGKYPEKEMDRWKADVLQEIDLYRE